LKHKFFNKTDNKSACLKNWTFIFICIAITIFYILTCFPVTSKTIFIYTPNFNYSSNSQPSIQKIDRFKENIGDSEIEILKLYLNQPVNPQISDYLFVSMTAENLKGVQVPTTSIAVNLSEETIDLPFNPEENDKSSNETGNQNYLYKKSAYTIQERSKIFIDGINHTYYIPVGENKYWTYDWSSEGLIKKTSIDNLVIEMPEIDGILIDINKIELKKRNFLALDSYINYFFKNYFNITYINRYITPTYVFLILCLLMLTINKLISINVIKKLQIKTYNKRAIVKKMFNNSNTISSSNSYSRYSFTSKKIALFPKLILILSILILTLFSFYFINNNLFIIKSYWDSYKKYILSGNLDKTYYGFYNFEKFIYWIDKKIPEGENLIVLLRGEPVYIMAEMVYNLYPRDLKFLNVSNKNSKQIISDIEKINLDSKNKYKYIVILSKEDILQFPELTFVDKYRQTGGYIFKLANKF